MTDVAGGGEGFMGKSDSPLAIIHALRSGESKLKDPRKVVLAHTIVPLASVENWTEDALDWGCLVETTPGQFGVSLLGAWWMGCNSRN